MSAYIYGYNFTDEDKPKAARERFSDPRAFYTVFETFRRYDVKDEERRAKILAIYDKFLPYDPKDLEKAGQAWRTNINFGALTNAIDARAGAVSRIATETCNLISLDSPTPEQAGPDDEKISTVIEEEFSKAMRNDGRVINALALMNKEADLYGCGPITWRDPETYVPEALRRGQVLFDPEGSVNPDDHEIIMIDTVMEASALFRLLDNPDMAEKAGWNMEEVKKWIVRVFDQGYDTRSNTSADGGVSMRESIIETMRRNDFYENNQFRKFHVIIGYVREMKAPRKVTQIIAPATSQAVDGTEPDKVFLYKRENAYDSMEDVFTWLLSNRAQHYIKSVRGIASDVAPKAAARDRLGCAMVDSAIRALSMVVQQKNPGASPVESLQEIGPYTVVGSDYAPVPNANQLSNFQGVMSVQQMLDADSTGNLAGTAFGQTMPHLTTGGTAPSKAEAELAERRQTQRDENFMASRLMTWKTVWAVTFRRFMKIATGPEVIRREYKHVDRFVKECEARGVTVPILRDALKRFSVDVSREVIIGMDGLTQFISSALAQFGGNADEVGRKKMSHWVVRYQLGKKLANQFFPIESRDNVPSNDASIATLENNALQAGQSTLPGSDQRHVTHINIHMQVLQQIQETVQNGIAEAQREWQENGQMQQNADGELAPKVDNPEQLMQILQTTSQHIQQHIAMLATQGDAVKGTVKEYQKAISGLGDLTQALNLAIATQRRVREAEEEKRQRELDELRKAADQAEIQKANHKAELEAQNARHKIDLDHQIALEKLRLDGETGRARLAMEVEQMRGKSRLDFESAKNQAMIESERARQEMDRKNAESQQSMALSRSAAEQDANLRASAAAAERMEGRQRMREITGRGTPQPADFTGAAGGGLIPL